MARIQDYVKGYFTEKIEDKKKRVNSEGEFSIAKRLTTQIEFDPIKYGFTDNGTQLVSWIDAFSLQIYILLVLH